MLIMESAFGLPGIVAAPIYYAYLKDELVARTAGLTGVETICSRSATRYAFSSTTGEATCTRLTAAYS